MANRLGQVLDFKNSKISKTKIFSSQKLLNKITRDNLAYKKFTVITHLRATSKNRIFRMNAFQLNKINEKLQSAIGSTFTVLTAEPWTPTTINLPVATLHAFFAIQTGLIETIPEIHRSKFHTEVLNLASEFLNWSPLLQTTLLLEDLHAMPKFTVIKEKFTTLVGDALVIGDKPAGNKLSWSIDCFAINVPELATTIAAQNQAIKLAITSPLHVLFNQIAGELQQNAQRKGFTVSREECLTVGGIREPKIYWISKKEARQIRDKHQTVRIRATWSSQSQSPKRLRLTDSQTSDEML